MFSWKFYFFVFIWLVINYDIDICFMLYVIVWIYMIGCVDCLVCFRFLFDCFKVNILLIFNFLYLFSLFYYLLLNISLVLCNWYLIDKIDFFRVRLFWIYVFINGIFIIKVYCFIKSNNLLLVRCGLIVEFLVSLVINYEFFLIWMEILS